MSLSRFFNSNLKCFNFVGGDESICDGRRKSDQHEEIIFRQKTSKEGFYKKTVRQKNSTVEVWKRKLLHKRFLRQIWKGKLQKDKLLKKSLSHLG